MGNLGWTSNPLRVNGQYNLCHLMTIFFLRKQIGQRTRTIYTFLSGHFAYIDDSFKANLQSPELPWKQFHESVGLCLRFKYLMPVKSKSSLKVLLREPTRKEPVLVWQVIGNHGSEWSGAQLAWSGAQGIQVSTNHS